MGKRDTQVFKKQYKDALSQGAKDPFKNIKDIKKGFIPSREQILKAVTTGVVIVLCALAGFSVQLILKRGTTEQIVEKFITPNEGKQARAD